MSALTKKSLGGFEGISVSMCAMKRSVTKMRWWKEEKDRGF